MTIVVLILIRIIVFFKMMQYKKKTFLVLITTILLVTSALSFTASPASAQAGNEEEDTIKIAFVNAMSQNALSFYAGWARNGFLTGMSYVTGDNCGNPQQYTTGDTVTFEWEDKTIEVKIYDTQGSGDKGVEEARTAITEWGADILVGNTWSPVASSVVGVAKTYETPYFLLPAASASLTQDPKFNQYVFRVGRNNWHDALTSAYYYGEMQEGYDEVSFLAINNAFGRSGVNTAIKAFERYGIEKAGDPVYVPPDETDFLSYVQEAQDQDADLVYVVWAGNFGNLYKTMKDVGIFDKLAGSIIDMFTMNLSNFGIPGAEDLVENVEGFCYFSNYVNSGEEYQYMLDYYQQNDVKPDAWVSAIASGDWVDTITEAEVPELWAGQAFATSQFVLQGLNEQDFDVDTVKGEDGLIAQWEGMELDTPLGSTLIRPYDHQAVRPMYIGKAVVDEPGDDFGSEETEGLIVGERVVKVPRKFVDPPIKTDYEPYVTPYEVNFEFSEVTPDDEAPPQEVEFTVEALRGQQPYTMDFDFDGDGTFENTVTGITASTSIMHTYEEGGEYNVTVNVIDNQETQVQKSQTVTVPSSGIGGMSTTTIAAIIVIIIVIIAIAAFGMRS